MSTTSSSPGIGKSAVVVGAGPVGCLTAMYLARMGYKVDVYDKRRNLTHKAKAGSPTAEATYSLILNRRGLKPLDELGIQLPPSMGTPHKGTVMLIKPGVTSVRRKSPTDVGMRIDRNELTDFLASEVNLRYGKQVSFHWQHSFLDYDVTAAELTFQGPGTFLGGSPAPKVVKVPDLLVAADGVNSGIRDALAMADAKLKCKALDNEAAYMAFHGIKDAQLLADCVTKTEIDVTKDAYTFGAVTKKRKDVNGLIMANRVDGSVSGVAYAPGVEGMTKYEGNKDLLYDDLVDAFPSVPKEMLFCIAATCAAGPSYRAGKSIWCSCLASGNVALVGDAAHGMSASLGQGLNSGFETVGVLARCLDGNPDDVPAALEAYDRERRADAHAITSLSHVGMGYFGHQGKLNPHFLAAASHLLVGYGIKTLAPSFRGPAFMRMGDPSISFSAIRSAIYRDGLIVGGLVAATAGLVAARCLASKK